jgi:hypothetical protein
MIDHDQNDATTNMNITSFTMKVARAKSAHMEKSISCASARVSASICLLFICLAVFRPYLWGNYSILNGKANTIRMITRV